MNGAFWLLRTSNWDRKGDKQGTGHGQRDGATRARREGAGTPAGGEAPREAPPPPAPGPGGRRPPPLRLLLRTRQEPRRRTLLAIQFGPRPGLRCRG